MVCDRCKAAVAQILSALGLRPLSVELGTAVVAVRPQGDKLEALRAKLAEQGFELIDDKRDKTVEKIKSLIIELVHYSNSLPSLNISEYLSQKLAGDYGTLSKMFSEATGTTVEKYFIAQRIERVKELLSYGDLSLSEIAYKLDYSSVAYLSAQFKKVTGMTPSQYRKLGGKSRLALDKV